MSIILATTLTISIPAQAYSASVEIQNLKDGVVEKYFCSVIAILQNIQMVFQEDLLNYVKVIKLDADGKEVLTYQRVKEHEEDDSNIPINYELGNNKIIYKKDDLTAVEKVYKCGD